VCNKRSIYEAERYTSNFMDIQNKVSTVLTGGGGGGCMVIGPESYGGQEHFNQSILFVQWVKRLFNTWTWRKVDTVMPLL